MKNIIISILLVLSFTACTEAKREVADNNSHHQPVQQTAPQPLFDFDEVDYYTLATTEQALKQKLTPQRYEVVSIFFHNDGSSITKEADTINNFTADEFTKYTINVQHNPTLNDIFKENFQVAKEFTACEPTYRDIFVFKKNQETVGIAKICFDCGQSNFMGTDLMTQNFGTQGEFAKLRQLIEQIQL